MTEIDELLDRIEVPSVDVADDVARGEGALRRRRRWQVSGAAGSVVATVLVLTALHGGTGGPATTDPGFADQSGAAGPSTSAASPGVKADRQRAHHRVLTAKQRNRRLARRLSSTSTEAALQGYHDVLAEHLDPGGDKLRFADNEQWGGGTLGTKLDWNGGGMLEIVVGHRWSDAGGFYDLQAAAMRDTTFEGHPARVSTAGDDLVVSVRHPDGTVVSLVASISFGNNGTSTPSLGLTQRQLLDAAADPRLRLPADLP